MPQRQALPAPGFQQFNWPAAVWLCVIASLGLLQPFLLGFYLDDWSLMGLDAAIYGPFSRQLWNSIVAIDPTRPVSVVFRWVSSSLLRDVPVFWHAALVCANGLIAFQLACLVRMLAPSGSTFPLAVALPLAAAWMSLPWMSGVRFWPTMLNVHVYFVVFLWLMLHLLRRWRAGNGPILLPFLAYLAVCLGYEALYFQFAVLVGVAAAEVRFRAVPKASVTRSLVALVAAQAGAVACHFLLRALFGGPRSVRDDWFLLLVHNLKQTLPQMFGSFGPARWLAAVAFSLLLGGIVAALRQARQKDALKWPDMTAAALVLAAFAAGSVGSVAAFSAGGRTFSGFGVEARGLSVISLWATAAMVLLVTLALAYASGLARLILTLGLWLSATALLSGQLMQYRDWHEAARLQERVLSLVPVAAMLQTEPDAKILCIFPSEVRGAPVFSAPWDLNSALYVSYPALAGKHFIGYSPWGGFLRWDGKSIWSEWFPQNKTPAAIVYLWRPFHGEFLKLERPIVVQQNLDWKYTQ